MASLGDLLFLSSARVAKSRIFESDKIFNLGVKKIHCEMQINEHFIIKPLHAAWLQFFDEYDISAVSPVVGSVVARKVDAAHHFWRQQRTVPKTKFRPRKCIFEQAVGYSSITSKRQF